MHQHTQVVLWTWQLIAPIPTSNWIKFYISHPEHKQKSVTVFPAEIIPRSTKIKSTNIYNESQWRALKSRTISVHKSWHCDQIRSRFIPQIMLSSK